MDYNLKLLKTDARDLLLGSVNLRARDEVTLAHIANMNMFANEIEEAILENRIMADPKYASIVSNKSFVITAKFSFDEGKILDTVNDDDDLEGYLPRLNVDISMTIGENIIPIVQKIVFTCFNNVEDYVGRYLGVLDSLGLENISFNNKYDILPKDEEEEGEAKYEKIIFASW